MLRSGVNTVSGAIKNFTGPSSSNAAPTTGKSEHFVQTDDSAPEPQSETETSTVEHSNIPSEPTTSDTPPPALPPRPGDERIELAKSSVPQSFTPQLPVEQAPPSPKAPSPQEPSREPEPPRESTPGLHADNYLSTMSDLTEREPKPESEPQAAGEAKAAGETLPEGVQPLKGDESDEEIAKKLSAIIDQALDKVTPLLDMMNEAFEKAEHDRENDKLDEEALVKQVRPQIEQATNILRETQGAIKALDPDGTIANRAQRKAQDHEASKEEQHLAESLGRLTGDVTKTIENAKKKIANMPKAKRDLGPLLEILSDPLFQIVSGVGLLLNGVLSLLGRLLDGLGLGGIVRNILAGLGLEKVLKGLGLTGLFPSK